MISDHFSFIFIQRLCALHVLLAISEGENHILLLYYVLRKSKKLLAIFRTHHIQLCIHREDIDVKHLCWRFGRIRVHATQNFSAAFRPVIYSWCRILNSTVVSGVLVKSALLTRAYIGSNSVSCWLVSRIIINFYPLFPKTSEQASRKNCFPLFINESLTILLRYEIRKGAWKYSSLVSCLKQILLKTVNVTRRPFHKTLISY